MKKRKHVASGEEGQATIEFALSMILLLAFILFYIQLSLVFAWGNYVHYATFMSARAYLAGGPDPHDQQERAKDVIVRMLKRGAGREGLDRFPQLGRGVGGDDVPGLSLTPPPQWSPTDRDLSWMEGVRYTFRSRLFLVPFAGLGGRSPANNLTLTSESWLGREPTFDDCLTYMSAKGWIIDNGC